MLRLKDVEVCRSKVYITVNGHSYHYGIKVLDEYGDYKVSSMHILNGIVYLELKE